MIKIGILGIAHTHGYSYVRQINQMHDAQVTGLYEENTEFAKRAESELKLKLYNSPQELLDSCDAVIIASENSKHMKYTEMAALKHKHVLCEKPIAVNISDAEHMIKVCKENNVVLQIAFPVRYAPSVRKAKETIDSGVLGDILAVSSTNHGTMPGSWFVEKELSGGGAVIDHTVHVVDIVRWLLNTEITNVSGFYDKLIYDELKVEDCGLLMLELSNGAFMTLDTSWSRPKAHPYWGDVTIRIVGTQGTLFIDAFDEKIEYYCNDKKNGWMNFDIKFDYNLIREFIDCIKTGRKPLTSGEDGLAALEVVLKAYAAKA